MNLEKEKIKNLSNIYGLKFKEKKGGYWIKGKSMSGERKLRIYFDSNRIKFISEGGFFSVPQWWIIKDKLNIKISDIDKLIRFLSNKNPRKIDFDNQLPHLKIERCNDYYSLNSGWLEFGKRKSWVDLSKIEKGFYIIIIIIFFVFLIFNF